MNRRGFLAGVVSTPTVAVVAGCTGGDGGGDGSDSGGGGGGWDFEGTFTSSDGDTVRETIGDLEPGTKVGFEVVLHQGRSTRASIINRDDGGAIVYDRLVLQEPEDGDKKVVTPLSDTVDIPEPGGEHFATVSLLASDAEVTMRFRVL